MRFGCVFVVGNGAEVRKRGREEEEVEVEVEREEKTKKERIIPFTCR